MRRHVKACAATFRIGVRTALAEPATMLGAAVIYSALVLSYAALFKATDPARFAAFGLDAERMIWYFAVSETLICAIGTPFKEMQADILSGAIGFRLLRPLDFWPLQLAEWWGQFAVRGTILAAWGFAIAWSLTGTWPWLTPSAALLPTMAMAGALVILAAHLMIGAAALWLGQSEPVWWFLHKLTFVLGALLFPLALYPETLRIVAWSLPFPAMVAAPANLALGASNHGLPWQILHQAVVLAVLLVACAALAAAVRRRIRRTGV